MIGAEKIGTLTACVLAVAGVIAGCSLIGSPQHARALASSYRRPYSRWSRRLKAARHGCRSRRRLRTDDRGRFGRTGLTPGSYTIVARNTTDRYQHEVGRLAYLEPDDVLDVPIGMFTDRLVTRYLCVAYRVPPALTTSDRYIIH